MNFFSTDVGVPATVMSHYVLPWIVFLTGIFLLVRYQNTIRTSPYERRVRIGVTLMAVLFELTFWVWTYRGDANYNMYDYLITYTMFPIQACALSLWMMVYCSISRNVKVFKIFFFMSIVGPLVTMVAGGTALSYDRFRYYHYYLVHMFTFFMAVHLLVYNRVRFTPKDYRNVTIYILIHAAVAVPINIIFGTNYLFLYNAYDTPMVNLPKAVSSGVIIFVFFAITTLLYFGVNRFQEKESIHL